MSAAIEKPDDFVVLESAVMTAKVEEVKTKEEETEREQHPSSFAKDKDKPWNRACLVCHTWRMDLRTTADGALFEGNAKQVELLGKQYFEYGQQSETGFAEPGSDDSEADMKRAFQHYLLSAIHTGHAGALLKVGEFYCQGYNVVHIDYEMAEELFRWAWLRGEAGAAAWLARLALTKGTGRGGAFQGPHAPAFSGGDVIEASKWIQAGLDHHCPYAYFLARHAGHAIEEAARKSKAWTDLYRDIHRGFRDACFFYAVYAAPEEVLRGMRVVEPPKVMLEELSALGHADGLWWLASKTQWDMGHNTLPLAAFSSVLDDKKRTPGLLPEQKINPNQHLLLHMAAKQRHPIAMADLSTEFMKTAQWARAFHYAEEAADLGVTVGWWNLGLLFFYGFGVAADRTRAVNCIKKAAKQGHPIAIKVEAIFADFPNK